MFELYKKVSKSLEYTKGAKKILEGENPFAEGPCLLCISAQNQADKSIFGLTKLGARMAKVRVAGNSGARIPLDEVPIRFLSIKPDNMKEKEEVNIKKFVETYIKPLLVDEKGSVKPSNMASKVFRNINIMSNCDGTKRALDIIKGIEELLVELDYTETEIDKILSQISLISFQTEISLKDCKASIIDFHNINDREVRINTNNITSNMLENNSKSKNGESIEIDKNRIEVLISGEDSHQVRDYIENGEAVPVIVYTMISSILENSIKNSQTPEDCTRLSIEELFLKAKTILERINKGERKEDLIEQLDESLSYGKEIEKLSERELKLIELQEQAIDEYVGKTSKLNYSEKQVEELGSEKANVLKVAENECTEGTYLRILKASGWQINSEQEDKIENSETDSEIIEKQDKQIKSLQEMLSRVLQFATDVKNSIFGKIFFKKSIKQLPDISDKKDFDR